MKQKLYIYKINIVDIFPIALMCAFNLTIFSPLEIYFANISNFWFGLHEIGIICIISFFLIFFILMLISIVGIKYRQIGKGLLLLFFNFSISMYIQGNYANDNLGIMNGQEINWEQFGIYGIISILVWLIPLVLSIVIVKAKGMALFKRIAKIISICLFLVQLITIATLLFTVNTSTNDNDLIITNDRLFEVSENKNIMIICLDTFDAYEYNELLSESKIYELDNFVYYKNTAGAYPTTEASIPYILTGEWNDNSKMKSEYLREAYQDTSVYKQLKKNKYSIGIYTNDRYISDEIKEELENAQAWDIIPSSYFELGKNFYQLVAFKYAPHQLKSYFWFYPEFNDLRAKKGGGKTEIYSQDIKKFYDNLMEDRINIVKDNVNSFKFYHTTGIHGPYTFDENLEDMDGANSINEAKGNITLLKEMMNQLKDEGIYDNTAIIILADHGNYNYSQNPLLLVKDFNSDGSFEISDAPISFEDLMPTIIYWITDESESNTVFDVTEGQERDRRFLWYQWLGDANFAEDYLPQMQEYYIIGKAYDTSSMIRSKNVFDKGNQKVMIYKYVDGKTVYFDGEEDFLELTAAGFSFPEKSSDGKMYCWSLGKESQMIITFDSKNYNDIVMEVKAYAITPEQVIEVYINDDYLTTIENIKTEFQVVIPKEYMNYETDINIKLIYPNAIFPYEAGIDNGEDSRMLSICYESIMFTEMK